MGATRGRGQEVEWVLQMMVVVVVVVVVEEEQGQ